MSGSSRRFVRAFAFVVYFGPKEHKEILDMRSGKLGEDMWSEGWESLSQEEVRRVVQGLVGRNTWEDHIDGTFIRDEEANRLGRTIPREGWGYIAHAYQREGDGTLMVYVVPHDNAAGRRAVKRLITADGEPRMPLRGCSLQHAHYMDQKVMRAVEVSDCQHGAREGTYFAGVRYVPEDQLAPNPGVAYSSEPDDPHGNSPSQWVDVSGIDARIRFENSLVNVVNCITSRRSRPPLLVRCKTVYSMNMC